MKRCLLFFITIFSICCTKLYAQETFELFADNHIENQSAAIFNQYLFSVKDRLSSVSLYDLNKKRLIYTLKLAPHNEKNEDGFLVYHCNQCCFGKERYEENDYFPLFYISQRNPNNTLGALITVFRIVPHTDANSVIDSFEIENVQSIYLPVMTDQNSMGNPNLLIDTKKGFLYTYSRNNNTKASNYGITVISKFDLPALYKNGVLQKEVFLTDHDILDSFPCDFKLINAQGGFLRKGKIYIAQGYPNVKYVYFREINIKKRRQTKVVDMLDLGFIKEPEGVWYYNGHVMVTTDKKEIFRLNGKQFKVK